VEQVIGRWKRRFHSLHGELRIKLDKVPQFIIAAAVLHNICRMRGQPDVDDEEMEDNEPPADNVNEERAGTGTNARISIVDRYFSH
jgi:hypothetical protein